MKKQLLSFALFFLCLAGYAQNDSIKVMYCELNASFNYDKISIEVVPGNNKQFNEQQFGFIKDEKTGKAIKFNNTVDAFNFMSEHGWVYIDNYILDLPAGHVACWIFKQMFVKDADEKYKPLKLNDSL
jgi:hypothetical protein